MLLRSAFSRRSRLSRCAVAIALVLAAPAGASWNGTKPYTIFIVAGGGSTQEVEDAGDVEVQNVMHEITIGVTSPTPDAGELTVVGEGSGLDRKILGTWNINNGTGNVQSVIATANVFRVGGGNVDFDLPGILNLEAGGTIYADATEINGTINENGGTLVVPERASAFAALGACAALVVLARRSRARR